MAEYVGSVRRALALNGLQPIAEPVPQDLPRPRRKSKKRRRVLGLYGALYVAPSDELARYLAYQRTWPDFSGDIT